MENRATDAGLPVHPVLAFFPGALWVFSFIADLVYFSGGDPIWSEVAYCHLAGGILAALVAAMAGAADLRAAATIPARRAAILYMRLHLGMLALYAINFWMRTEGDPNFTGPVWLSALGVALVTVAGRLGSEMMHRHGAGMPRGHTAHR
jgi:uncharacterized membrane protein